MIASMTDLMKAVGLGQVDKVQSLLARRADINARDSSGRTALHLAATLGQTACVRLLMNAGCDPNVKDAFGGTAIHRAVTYGHPPSAQVGFFCLVFLFCFLSFVQGFIGMQSFTQHS